MAIERISVPAARKEAGLTQSDLALSCGVSVSTIANWEKGVTEPTISQAKKIAEVVGVDLDDLSFLPSVTV